MSIWQRVKKWCLAEETKAVERLQEDYNSMVGEPVISFLESFKREPKRYSVKPVDGSLFLAHVPTFVWYKWMAGDVEFWVFSDHKTGTDYWTVIHRRKIYSVYGLPFQLNHWEMQAIQVVLEDARKPARERRERIRSAAWDRGRKVAQEHELRVREEFAKQFREE